MRFAATALLAAFLLAGCAGSEASSTSVEDVSAGAAPLGDVTVEKATLTWGSSQIYGGDAAHVAGVHAFQFTGEAGDKVVATSSSDSPGTLFVLRTTGESAFTVLAESPVTTTQGTVSVMLPAAGTYAIGYAAKPAPEDPGALFPASYSVSLSLRGTPAGAANKLAAAVRAAWEDSTDFTETERAFVAIPASKLPAAAKKRYDAQPSTASTWAIGGGTVYVVESRSDEALTIAFYDLSGRLIATGSATEGEEFAWND